MAKTIGIELDFNTKGAQASTKDFAKEVDKATKTLGGLEEQQDELLAKLKQTEVGTEEFRRLSKELNNTKSQIKDLELGFEGLDMEQRFTAAADALGGVAGGFAAVEGAIAIAGVESEEFEKQMLKVQGAMALAMGIKDISTAAAAIKKLNLATKAAAVAQRVLNVVMSANPIGLIVTAIGLLVAGFVVFSDKIRNIAKVVLAPLIIQFELIKAGIEAVGSALGLIPSAAERAAKAQADAAYAARVAILEENRKSLADTIKRIEKERSEYESLKDFEIAKLRAAGKETFEVEQEKLKYVLESLNKQKEALIEKHRLEAELVEENSKRYAFNYRLQAALGNDITEKSNKKRAEQMQELEQQITKTEQDITLGQITEDKKRSDAAKKAYEERQKAEEEAQKKREEEAKKHAERMAMIDKEINDRLAQQQKDARALTREELNAEREQEQLENDAFWAENYKRTQEALENQRQKELETEKAVAEAKMLLQESVVKGAEALTQLLVKDAAKAEKIQKAIALSQIAIDTAKAISALTANSEANPANAVTGGLAGIAQFASGIARILANMAQAAALLKKPAPQVGGTSSSAAGTAIAANGVPINPVNNGSTLIGQGNNGREVNKVVVVESDITNTQNTINRIVSNATVVE